MNSIILSGTATRDVEIKQMGQYTMAKFSLAVKRPYVPGKESIADFFKVEAWGKLAEWCAAITKGTKVYAAGSAKLNSWIDKTTGAKRYEVSFVATEVEIGNSKINTPSQIPPEMLEPDANEPETNTGEIPF